LKKLERELFDSLNGQLKEVVSPETERATDSVSSNFVSPDEDAEIRSLIPSYTATSMSLFPAFTRNVATSSFRFSIFRVGPGADPLKHKIRKTDPE